MIRNLKALALALVAVSALGAVAASGARAAARFTAPGAGAGETTTLTSTTDGTGKSTHEVFDIASGSTTLSLTCPEIRFTNAEIIGPEAASITATLDFIGIPGEGCRLAGQNVTINSGACAFVFKADGSVEIKTDTNVTGECKHTRQPIVFENTVVGCKVEVGEQILPAGSVAYTNIKPGKMTEEITLSSPGAKGVGIEGIIVNATGVGCPFGTGQFGTFTTGNTILTGERGGAMRDIKWDAT